MSDLPLWPVRRVARRATVGCLTALLTVTVASAPVHALAEDAGRAAPAGAGSSVRILVEGDSVTQGSAGDYTWRYLLWQHLEADRSTVDLVGPRDDLRDNVTGAMGSQAYVDPAFDRDHAARWGMTAAFPDHPLGTLVGDYDPDVVVIALGVNDLLFLHRTPEQVAGDLGRLVSEARESDAGIDVVLVRITQQWFSGVPELNRLISQTASSLDTAGSRVVAAAPDVGYDREADTWDGSHPAASGELRIAAAVEDALADLGLGSRAPSVLPAVTNGPRLPPVVSVTPDVGRVRLDWTTAPGATDYVLLRRDVVPRAVWRVVAEGLTSDTITLTGLRDWDQLVFRLIPGKGTWAGTPSSEAQTGVVQVLGDRLGTPVVRVQSRSARTARLAWDPVPGATSYEVSWRRVGARRWFHAHRVASGRLLAGQLDPGSSYRFRVDALRGTLRSPSGFARTPSARAGA